MLLACIIIIIMPNSIKGLLLLLLLSYKFIATTWTAKLIISVYKIIREVSPTCVLNGPGSERGGGCFSDDLRKRVVVLLSTTKSSMPKWACSMEPLFHSPWTPRNFHSNDSTFLNVGLWYEWILSNGTLLAQVKEWEKKNVTFTWKVIRCVK